MRINISITASLIIALTFLSGCGQLQVITEQDELDAIDLSIDSGVIVPVYYDSARELQEAHEVEFNGTYRWLGSTCYIFAIRDACVVRHEADHCRFGDWHGDNYNDECGESK